MPKSKISDSTKDFFLACRWRARTDKLWLGTNVLGYDRLNPKIHAPMAAKLQQFPMPSFEVARECDVLQDNGKFKYTPWMDPYDLEGSRRVLILFSRGYFKTTLNTICDVIQWILNYPQLAYSIIFSVDQKGQDTLREVKAHFTTNQKFRELFPDYCPQIRMRDWGTSESFIVPNRDDVLFRLNRPPRRESTLSTMSLDKSGVGYHFDLIKASDIVDPTNVITPMQRENVYYRFGLLKDMLVKVPGKRNGSGWINVEGTFYHQDDLYTRLVKAWKEQQPHERQWDIFIGGCFVKDTGDNAPRYDPNEMLPVPFKLDSNGKRIPTWPEMDSLEKLEKEEKDPLEGGTIFANQRCVDQAAVRDEFLKPLQIQPMWIKREDYRKIPIVYYIAVGDLANTQGLKANPSCLTVFGVDRGGRAYVEDIRHGKFSSDELINHIFDIQLKYKPLRFVIEETGFTQGLRPSLERESHLKSIFINWEFRPAPRDKDKATRIILALQPPLKKGDLRFVEPLFSANAEELKVLTTEQLVQRHEKIKKILFDELWSVTPYSTGSSDDIIDTFAYFFLSREWLGRELLRENSHLTKDAHERLLQEALSPGTLNPNIHNTALTKLIFDPIATPTELYHNKAGW